MNMKIQVASVSDREKLVAEIWLGDVHLAEISNERGEFEIEIYTSNGCISMLLDDYVQALGRAKQELVD